MASCRNLREFCGYLRLDGGGNRLPVLRRPTHRPRVLAGSPATADLTTSGVVRAVDRHRRPSKDRLAARGALAEVIDAIDAGLAPSAPVRVRDALKQRRSRTRAVAELATRRAGLGSRRERQAAVDADRDAIAIGHLLGLLGEAPARIRCH